MISADASLLTQTQKDHYQRDGFLIIKDFISPTLCKHLMQRAKELMDQYAPGDHKTIFSAVDQRHAQHLYFLDSGGKIHFFFEEGAVDDKGNLKKEKSLCINKIGHALHDLDPVFYSFSRLHQIAVLVKDIGVANPLLLQSMYICKQPHIGGEVRCHQDSTYLFVKEAPVTGIWFALEDASIENGCLWAIPGGHHVPLKSRFHRDHHHVFTEVYDEAPWPMEHMVPLEVTQGSAIVLHGLLPHMSKENTSERSRHAYTLHVFSGYHNYDTSNWLQRPKELPLKGFLV